ALATGNGSRRNWNADRCRKMAPQKRRHYASRSRSRKVSEARLGMAGQTRRHHYSATQTDRLLGRLVTPALHLRRTLCSRGGKNFCRAFQEGPHLSRPAKDELGPGGANRVIG